MIAKPSSEPAGEDDLVWVLAGVDYIAGVGVMALDNREELTALRQRVTERIKTAATAR